MRFIVLTLFPGMFEGAFSESILARAVESGLVEIDVRDIRAHAHDRHNVADDAPYGGGVGMVMKPGPVVEAVEAARLSVSPQGATVIHLSPQGAVFNHARAVEMASRENIILLCGRYEGIDQRAIDLVADEEISIGDYVLTGGEIPAMVLVDAISRQIPGVVGRADSVEDESFTRGLLDWPHYTRPEVFRDLRVPEVLLSGHHANIAKWRQEQAVEKTRRVRPELHEKWLGSQGGETASLRGKGPAS